jgi:hypothetical protein
MALFKEFIKRRKESTFETVELYYSVFHVFSGNKKWYCRLWNGYNYTGAYGDSKFEAYKKAYSKYTNLYYL